MTNLSYPLSDEYMVYDYSSHRYILTEKYVLDKLGLNLRDKVGGGRAINAQAMINSILDTRVSRRIYSLIYAHNDKRVLEYVMAKSPTARQVLQDAMSEQLMYMLVDYNEGDSWLSKDAYNILATPIPELRGNALIYRQRPAPNLYMLPKVPDYTEGQY